MLETINCPEMSYTRINSNMHILHKNQNSLFLVLPTEVVTAIVVFKNNINL